MAKKTTKKQSQKKTKKKQVIPKQSLIQSDVFGEQLHVNLNRVYPMVVAATMSSGKSTLINALLGTDILPSKNEACTAKVFAILDDDTCDNTKLILTKNDGEIITIEENVDDALTEANNSDDISNIFIIGKVKGVTNTDKSLLIIDTPGPNNSMDSKHEEVTTQVLCKLSGGLLAYVINATNIGADDDFEFLTFIKNKTTENPNLDVVFIVNKIDEIDFEEESIENIMLHIRSYITDAGFENPTIIPISALSAKLFKKAINGDKLTRREYQEFASSYDLFRPMDNSLSTYVIEGGVLDTKEEIAINGEKYIKANIEAAIENTGLPYLERYIQQKQIQSTKHKKISIRKNS